ncbi:MAG: alpha/beta hydrolase [Chloroflexi bacterium]|nr:alpha/beta hydrolase [Chloroflexota bacterium]
MPSIQSRLIHFSLRNRHLFKFRLHRETWDWNTSIPAFRQECEQGALKVKLPTGVQVIRVAIPGLAPGLTAEWIRPAEGAPAEACIFYIHGGGYVSGTCSDHRGFVAKWVQASGRAALHYDYRLAPEHPFPAALEDTLTAYRWLLAQGMPPERVVMAGESAGGGLCLATLLALRDQGLPLPAAAVALSPWTDLQLTGESQHTRTRVAIDPPGMSRVCCAYYTGAQDPCLPWISPLYGDLRGLPPLLLYVGDYELMRDDTTRFAAKAAAAGVDVTLQVGEGMVHCYPLFAPLFPEATQAMQDIGRFIQAHTGARQAEAALTDTRIGEKRIDEHC